MATITVDYDEYEKLKASVAFLKDKNEILTEKIKELKDDQKVVERIINIERDMTNRSKPKIDRKTTERYINLEQVKDALRKPIEVSVQANYKGLVDRYQSDILLLNKKFEEQKAEFSWKLELVQEEQGKLYEEKISNFIKIYEDKIHHYQEETLERQKALEEMALKVAEVVQNKDVLYLDQKLRDTEWALLKERDKTWFKKLIEVFQ